MVSKRTKIKLVLLLGYILLSIITIASQAFFGFLLLSILTIVLWKLLVGRKRYGIRSVTNNGEEVESIAEKRIADYFANNKIRYEYSPAVHSGGWHKRLIGYPDFFLPDYNVYVEYWGMVDVENGFERRKYIKRMKWKMAQYHDNGIRFISLYPSNLDNLDWIFKAKLKDVAGA